MKKIFFILIVAVAFTSCSKDKTIVDDSNNTVKGARVKTFAEQGGISTYTYDGQGRVAQVDYSSGAKTVYEYSPGILTQKLYNPNGSFNYSYKQELNPDGTIKRTTISNNPNYEVLILYNANGTEAKEIANISGSTDNIDYFYSAGNLDSMRFSGNNGWSLTRRFTYFTDKLNVLSNEVYGYNNLYGKDDNNLLKSEVYAYPDGSMTEPSNYSYEFDSQGRVIKRTISTGVNLFIGLYSYY